MRTIKFLLLALFSIVSVSLSAQATAEQKKFMSDIMSFLREEGYVPSYDSDGDIRFKLEGTSYWIIVSEGEGIDPFFVILGRSGYTLEGDNAYSYAPSVLACNDITGEKKAAKLYCTESVVSPSAQFFVSGITEFKKVYPRYMSCLKTVFNAFEDKYYEYEKQKTN